MVSTPSCGLLAKITASEGNGDALAEFLTEAVAIANDEAGTIAWFAVRENEDTCWVFDVFPSDEARQAHAQGAIAEAIRATPHLAEATLDLVAFDVLAAKLPE